jgi:hypothetical protein
MTMPRAGTLHERISDYSRCPQCVADQRVGYAVCYFNYDDQLFAVCKHHATKWLVTGRSLLHPAIPDLSEFPDLAYAFDRVEPYQPRTGKDWVAPCDPSEPSKPHSAARQRAHSAVRAKPATASRPGKHPPVRPSLSAAGRIKTSTVVGNGRQDRATATDGTRLPATTRRTQVTKREGFPTEIRTRRVLLDESVLPYPAG